MTNTFEIMEENTSLLLDFGVASPLNACLDQKTMGNIEELFQNYCETVFSEITGDFIEGIRWFCTLLKQGGGGGAGASTCADW